MKRTESRGVTAYVCISLPSSVFLIAMVVVVGSATGVVPGSRCLSRGTYLVGRAYGVHPGSVLLLFEFGYISSPRACGVYLTNPAQVRSVAWIARKGSCAVTCVSPRNTCPLRVTESRYVYHVGYGSFRFVNAFTGMDWNVFQEEQPPKGWSKHTTRSLRWGCVYEPQNPRVYHHSHNGHSPYRRPVL